jgi:hypothetical protein
MNDRCSVSPESRQQLRVMACVIEIEAELGLDEAGAGVALAAKAVRFPFACPGRAGTSAPPMNSTGGGSISTGGQHVPRRACRAPWPSVPRELRSNTGVASGWSPSLGSSPCRIRTLCTYLSAAAPMRSPRARFGYGRGRSSAGLARSRWQRESRRRTGCSSWCARRRRR